MNLIFTEQINKRPSYFIEKISNSLLLGMDEYLKYLGLYQSKFNKKWDGALSAMKPKKHSIREDKTDRWKVGMLIHFIINPYNSNRFQFAPTLPVTELQKILILTVDVPSIMVFVDGRKLNRIEVEELAINDGFNNLEDFTNYFKGEQDFEGKIIHWTHDFKY